MARGSSLGWTMTQVNAVATLAMACKPSVDFCGYWQRAQKKACYLIYQTPIALWATGPTEQIIFLTYFPAGAGAIFTLYASIEIFQVPSFCWVRVSAQ